MIHKLSLAFLCLSGCVLLRAASKDPQDLRGILLRQLHSTHDVAEWFVPLNTALEGLTPQQASWSDGKGNHSAGQLAYHLLFWNQRELEKLTGKKPAKFDGNNDETFNDFNAENWSATVQKLDQVMKEMEQFVQNADEDKLKAAAADIGRVSTHNAYHTGQILYVRKLQGSWNPEKGVK